MKVKTTCEALTSSQAQRHRAIPALTRCGIAVLLMFSVLACTWMPTVPVRIKPSPSYERVPVEYLEIPEHACAGESVTLVLQTLPGSECRMIFSYPVGNGDEKTWRFEAQVADAEGICSWKWEIPTDASPGMAGFRNDVWLSDVGTNSLIPKEFEIVKCDE